MATFAIRPIEPGDDEAVRDLVQTVMPEFGCEGPGFAISDPEVHHMHAAYAGSGAGYLVLERAGRVVGGAGFAPLEGGEVGVCELRKMYFLPEARGQGQGRRLLQAVLEAARGAGYTRCYLETTPQMEAAQALYRAAGFKRLDAPMGATGHHGCDVWYVLGL